MDRARITRIGHAGMRYWNPVPEAALDALLVGLDLPPRPSVLDIGCGSGAVLHTLQTAHAARCAGIDRDAVAVAAARELLGPGADLRAGTFDPDAWEGPFDVVVSLGALAIADFVDAVPLARHTVIVGDGYWMAPPSDGLLAALDASADDMPPLQGLIDALTAAGCTVRSVRTTSLGEWDAYEHGYAARIRAWLAEHPDDPDHAAYTARIDRWTALVEEHGRGVLGFAILIATR